MSLGNKDLLKDKIWLTGTYVLIWNLKPLINHQANQKLLSKVAVCDVPRRVVKVKSGFNQDLTEKSHCDVPLRVVTFKSGLVRDLNPGPLAP